MPTLRGRPYGRPPKTLTCREQIGWLLRVNRLYGPEPQWTKLSAFSAIFPGGCWPAASTPTTLSRWETGSITVPRPAIRRYEELLKLPPGSLTSIADVLEATAGDRATRQQNVAATRRRSAVMADADVDELIDRACSTEDMSGPDWDRLTEYLASHPGLRLHPTSRWMDLSNRLLLELTVATGVHWILRAEAMNRLLTHPVSGHYAVLSCVNIATDPRNQVFIDVVGILDATAIPEATQHVLAQLTNPTKAAAFTGAIRASVRKTRYGHFDVRQQQVLSGLVTDLLRENEDESALLVAANLARSARGRGDTRLERSLRRVLATLPASSATRDPLMTASAHRMSRSVSSAVADPAPADEDSSLRGLIEIVMCDADLDLRMNSAFLLAATPYRRHIGHALHGELRRSAGSGSTIRILDALQILGDQPQRYAIERMASSPYTSVELRSHAIAALAHMRGHSDDAFWQAAMDSTPADHVGSLVKIAYALGVNNNRRLLDRILTNPDLPEPVRTASRWWVELPRHISTSALT